MANKNYTSKYPLIKTDSNINNTNAYFNTKHLTVEEYMDLMHHTHSIGDLLGSNGEPLGEDFNFDPSGISVGVSKEEFDALKARVDEITGSSTDMSAYATKDDLTSVQSDVSGASDRIDEIERQLRDTPPAAQQDVDDVITRVQTIEEAVTVIQSLTQTIEEQSTKISTMEDEIANLKSAVEDIAKNGGFEIGDWDITTPEPDPAP